MKKNPSFCCLSTFSVRFINIIAFYFAFSNILIENSFAQDDIASLIVPQEQKIIEQEELNKQTKNFNDSKSDNEEEKSNQDNQSLANEYCFTINEINLEDNTVLSKRDISKISAKYLNTCITTAKITEIITAFSKQYKNKGYITTQVYVKEQNLNSKVLNINVIEGRLEDVKFGNNTIADKVTGYFITPLSKGSILNIKEIDQTTENLNYLSSYQYKTTLEPGSKTGLSKVSISGKNNFPISIYAQSDTIGQSFTGYNRYSVGTTLYNPLKLGDNFSLKYVSTFNDESDGKYSRSFVGSWSMPIKWLRIGINSSHSSYLSTIKGQLESFKSSGRTSSNSFFVNGIVFRNKSLKTTLVSTLNLLSSKSYINDAYSKTQSRNLSNIEVGVMNNLYTPYGSFFNKLTYIKGLNSFGAISDTPNNTYHAQFDAVKFYHLYSIKTDKIFNGKLPFTFQNTIDAQYAWQDVYSQNQFVLGGFYSVRGFRDTNIYSSKGVLTRNDIDFALIDYIKTPLLNKIYIGGFFDMGQASSYINSNTNGGSIASANYGTMAGAGYKIGYTTKYLSASLVVAHSIEYPDYLKESVKQNDGKIIYFNISGVW